jgi:hypothetical protein
MGRRPSALRRSARDHSPIASTLESRRRVRALGHRAARLRFFPGCVVVEPDLHAS